MIDTMPGQDSAVTEPPEAPLVASAPDLDWLALARQAHSASTTFFDSSIRTAVIEDIRQSMSLHPSGSKYYSDPYKARSRIFRPKTKAALRKNEATAAEAFFSTSDVISIEAENDGDAAQRAGADVMQQLLQYRLTKSIPWFMTSIGAYQDAQTTGVCISYQYWDYDTVKGTDKPCIQLVPIENLRIDPAASWTDPINTSPYIIHEIAMFMKDVKARMKPGPNGEPGRWFTVPDAQLRTAGERPADMVRLAREPKRQDSKGETSGPNEFGIVWVHRNIIEVDGRDYIYYTAGTSEMLSAPVPLEDKYFHGQRPYVMGLAVIETHKVYPSSVPRLGRDTQSEINEIANQRIDNVKFAMNKSWFVKRNKQVDIRSLTRRSPNSVTLMESLDDVREVDVRDVTASSYQEQDRLAIEFDDVTGSFSQASVQSNRNLNETVGGMNILDKNASQVGGYQLRTFVETWVEPVLRQLVLLEAHYESDERILALAGSKVGLAEQFPLELLKQELTLSVNVGMGATNPQSRLTNVQTGFSTIKNMLADSVMENHGLNVKEFVTEVLGIVGYKSSSRFFGDDDPVVTNLKAQVQQLSDALKSKLPPELLAKQIEKIDADIKKTVAQQVEVGVNSAFAAMQAGQVIALTPSVAPVADAIMQGAGYQAPVPAGVDPNFPQPEMAAGAQPVPAPAPADMQAAQSQVAQQQAPNDSPMAALMRTNTSPQYPAKPMSAMAGAKRGIETARADSGPPQGAV